RDGEQSPGFSMNQEEKLQLARQLERLRADVIEAGFPIASKGDFRTVRKISEQITESTVAALCRTSQKDIDRAAEAVEPAAKPRIHTFIATSDIHMKYKLKKSREEVLESAVEAVEYARKFCEEVEFSAEDASRSDPEFLYKIFEAVINAGASVINVPDTVGYAMPWEFGQLIGNIRKNVPNIDQATVSVHCHNDLGVAVANSLMAIRNGAQQIECTINGIGERAGNASLEEIVMAIGTREESILHQTNIATEELMAASRLLTEITGNEVQPNKAIVGKNAFAHEAGIHQHGVLNNPMTYEIMTPESVGLTSNNIVLGKHSGRFALSKRLESIGYKLEKNELNKLYHTFTDLADEQKTINDNDLHSLVSTTLPHRKVSGDTTVTQR
ncbi:MAG TPA: 2-isopropylmalate synthase, partial [Fodinibius sp.]|nr:2-isopropylmalate synthase [Fodinibius sp.]